jgi:hypothetical protein
MGMRRWGRICPGIAKTAKNPASSHIYIGK